MRDFYEPKTGLLRQKVDLRLGLLTHPCLGLFPKKKNFFGRQFPDAINFFERLTWVGEQWDVEEE